MRGEEAARRPPVKPSTLIGTALVVVALVDVVVGLFLVAPRAPESSRAVLRAAFVGGAAVMILLGAAFLADLLGGS
jgi:hypothetical protein